MKKIPLKSHQKNGWKIPQICTKKHPKFFKISRISGKYLRKDLLKHPQTPQKGPDPAQSWVTLE